MLNRYGFLIKNNIIVFLLFSWHLLNKWGIKKSFLIATTCLVLASVIFPVAVSYLFFENEINIIHSIVTYLLFILWTISIIIFLNPMLINKLESNIKYSYDLGLLLNKSHRIFIESYEKYKYGKNIFKQDHEINYEKNFDKYNETVINIIYMELFKMYFKNLNNSNNGQKFLYVNTKFLIELESDNKLNDFYGKVFFNYNNENSMKTFNKIKIHIMDKVVDQLNSESWFEHYYANSDIFDLIDYITKIWCTNIIEYSKSFTNILVLQNVKYSPQ